MVSGRLKIHNREVGPELNRMDFQTVTLYFKLKRFLSFSPQTPGSILSLPDQQPHCGIPYTRETQFGCYNSHALCEPPEAGAQGRLVRRTRSFSHWRELDQLSYTRSPSRIKDKLIDGSLHLRASTWCYGIMDHGLLERDVQHLPQRKFGRPVF